MIMPKPISLPKEYSESVEISYNTVMRHQNSDQDYEDENENQEYDNFNRKSYQNGDCNDLITINNKAQANLDFKDAQSPNKTTFKTNPGISQSKTTTNGSVNLYGVKDCSFSKASRSSNQTGIIGITGSKLGTESSGHKGEGYTTMNTIPNNSKNNRSNSRKNQKKVNGDSKSSSLVRGKNLPISNIGDFSETENDFEGKKTPNNKKPSMYSGSTSTKDTSNITSGTNTKSKGQKIPVPKPTNKEINQKNLKNKTPLTQPKKEPERLKKGGSKNLKTTMNNRDDQVSSNDKDYGLYVSSSQDRNLSSTKDASSINVLNNAYNQQSNNTQTTKLGTKSTKATNKNSSEPNTKRVIDKDRLKSETSNINGNSSISKQNMLKRQMDREQRQNFGDIEQRNNVEIGNKVASFVQEVKQQAYENVNNLQDNNPYKPSKKNNDEKV